MRDFFKHIVANLYTYCGNRQAEKMTDEELKTLYDALERVSKLYSYIPVEKQREIIEAQLLKDKEYQNINARLISKWLEENGKQYFVETAHKQVTANDPNYKPLEGDERDAMLTMWQDSLKQMNDTFTQASKPMGGGSRLREKIKDLPHEQIIEDPKLKRKETSLLDDYCQNPEHYVEPINQEGMETVNPNTEISTRENIS